MIMPKFLKKSWNVLSYMFLRKGFFTKRLVVATVTWIMMLFVDIRCGIWDGMGLCLLVLLSLYVIANYIIRYMDLKREDEEKDKEVAPVQTDNNAPTEIMPPSSDEKNDIEEERKEMKEEEVKERKGNEIEKEKRKGKEGKAE